MRKPVYSDMPALTTAQTAELALLSRDIHEHPELAYQERHALAAISALLEHAGHRVERGIGGLETAFRTRVGPPEGPAVALLAEYDALPEVGHGCGHNLIAISNIGQSLSRQRGRRVSCLELFASGSPIDCRPALARRPRAAVAGD